MSLKNFFPDSTDPAKVEFDALLDDIDSRFDFFAYVFQPKLGKIKGVSNSFEHLTGYKAEQLEAEGVGFFVSRIPEEDLLFVIKTQSEHCEKALQPNFDQTVPFLLAIPGRLQAPDGTLVPRLGTGLPLAYLTTGEIDVALIINAPVLPSAPHQKSMQDEIATLLTRAKRLYNKVYKVPPTSPHKSVALPMEIATEKNPVHPLSPREKEILLKISQGASSKEIALDLSISENTVETHRKNLLAKFEAKNIAELIKKASKVYWLE